MLRWLLLASCVTLASTPARGFESEPLPCPAEMPTHPAREFVDWFHGTFVLFGDWDQGCCLTSPEPGSPRAGRHLAQFATRLAIVLCHGLPLEVPPREVPPPRDMTDPQTFSRGPFEVTVDVRGTAVRLREPASLRPGILMNVPAMDARFADGFHFGRGAECRGNSPWGFDPLVGPPAGIAGDRSAGSPPPVPVIPEPTVKDTCVPLTVQVPHGEVFAGQGFDFASLKPGAPKRSGAKDGGERPAGERPFRPSPVDGAYCPDAAPSASESPVPKGLPRDHLLFRNEQASRRVIAKGPADTRGMDELHQKSRHLAEAANHLEAAGLKDEAAAIRLQSLQARIQALEAVIARQDEVTGALRKENAGLKTRLEQQERARRDADSGKPVAAVPREYQNAIFGFTAKWCGPCQQMSPLLARLREEGLPIHEINTDEYRLFAMQYGVTSLPSFLLVINGKIVERHNGVVTEETLRNMARRISQEEQRARIEVRAPGITLSADEIKLTDGALIIPDVPRLRIIEEAGLDE